jgi:hypothetical protein
MTSASIAGYLAMNDMQDQTTETDAVVDRIYLHGLRLHTVTSSLGRIGIAFGAQDLDGSYFRLRFGSAHDDAGKVRTNDGSIIGAVMDASLDSLDEATAAEYETALLLGGSIDDTSVGGRWPMLTAMHAAELEHWHELTGYTGADLMNMGAQLYCYLAKLQQDGVRNMYLIDRQMFALPLPQDLNGLALGDNPNWLKECGPVEKLPDQ